MTRRYSKTYNRNSRTVQNQRPTTQRKTSNYSCQATAFNQPRQECQWRMGSYRNVYSQFTGATKQTPFSPTQANKWLRYANNGYRIYKFTNKDFTRHFGNQWTNTTPTTCQRWMKQKYGSGIKAVTRGRGNTWLIATTGNVNARPFQNYTWK
ncbi:MAG: hypothetical protein PVJ57_08745 [Phycisphaerae bacterium]|jgi:hypothetical protein